MVQPSSRNRRSLAWLAILLAFITLLGVNLFAANELPLARVDLTQDRLFTMSGTTRTAMADVKEPIVARIYFSRRLGELAPAFQAYFDRVKALLDQYSTLSGGRIAVLVEDPEPFTDAEDRAVAAGLQGVPLGAGDQLGYFGVVATNSTDDQETLPFLAFERENFLEYDLTRMIYKLGHPERKTVGLITTVPILQSVNPMTGQQQPAWKVIDQIREFFEIKQIEPSATSIPDDVDVLMLVQPAGLNPALLYAIDQRALAGKPILVFADPIVEVAGPTGLGFTPEDGFLTLLDHWGIGFNPQQVVGDADHSRRVQYGSPSQPMVADYLVWLDMDAGSFDPDDPLFASIKTVTFATAGALTEAKDPSNRPKPLIETGLQSAEFPVSEVKVPDPAMLLQQFQPLAKKLPVMVRVQGEAKSAYPAGIPKNQQDAAAAASASRPEQKPIAAGHVNAIVIGDVDMLYDSFWADQRDLLGSQFLVPVAGNADMVLNALQNLSGGSALAGLRGRGVETRPFTLVEDIRRQAEARYRERQDALNQKLKQVEARVSQLQQASGDGAVILTDKDKRDLSASRSEMIGIRQQLRDVQRALREDIDRLDLWLKLANIVVVPIVIAVVGAIGLGVRRRRHGARRVNPRVSS